MAFLPLEVTEIHNARSFFFRKGTTQGGKFLLHSLIQVGGGKMPWITVQGTVGDMEHVPEPRGLSSHARHPAPGAEEEPAQACLEELMGATAIYSNVLDGGDLQTSFGNRSNMVVVRCHPCIMG